VSASPAIQGAEVVPDLDAFLRALSGAKSRLDRHAEKVATAKRRRPKSRAAAGIARTQEGGYEKTADTLERLVRAGAGYGDLDVLRFAYVALRDEWTRPVGPIRTPFDLEESHGHRKIELVGVAEVCEIGGLARMQLKRLRDAGKFPEPVAELAAGPIWRKDDLPWKNS
jgi:hypothetical protein